MKHTRTLLSALALALSFSQTPPVLLYAEEAAEEIAASEIKTEARKKETDPETDLPAPVIIRSVFLESDEETEENAVFISEKEIEAAPDKTFVPDYNLRAPENDEFALSHDGAVLNTDHYRLSRILVSGTEDTDFISTDLPVQYADVSGEEENIQITLVYEFIQPWHFVTIHYEDMETGEELFEAEVQKYPGSSDLKGPAAYDVKEFIKIRFEGYRFRGVSGDTLIGDSDSDKDIRILYEKVN